MKRWLFLGILLLFGTACNQNIERISGGQRLEEMPPPEAIGGSPFGSASQPAVASEGEDELEVPPFVKAYFMHTWVEALYSPPANRNPNPSWESPLVDPVDGRVWCTDCHTSGQVNFANIPKQRTPMVEPLENNPEFMADLMRKWVGRLNSDEFFARAKLKANVTCLTCHETNPAP